MRTMYDSVTTSAIPSNATMVAGYVNGHYANVVELRKRFPHATILGISVFGNEKEELADVLDIENGDAEPEEFRSWAVAMADAGVVRPTAYVARSNLIALLSMQPKHVLTDVWVGDWSGRPHPLSAPRANVVAVQYASPEQHSGGDFDLSAVYDDTWHPSS
jgi:hypothetical protein